MLIKGGPYILLHAIACAGWTILNGSLPSTTNGLNYLRHFSVQMRWNTNIFSCFLKLIHYHYHRLCNHYDDDHHCYHHQHYYYRYSINMTIIWYHLHHHYYSQKITVMNIITSRGSLCVPFVFYVSHRGKLISIWRTWRFDKYFRLRERLLSPTNTRATPNQCLVRVFSEKQQQTWID